MKTQKKTKRQESSTLGNEFLELKNPWNTDFNCFVKISDIVALVPQEDVNIINTLQGSPGNPHSGTTVTISSTNPLTKYTSIRLSSGSDLPDSRTPKELMAILTTKVGKLLYG